MSAQNAIVQMSNPDTPMAWLPPDLAVQKTLSAYIVAGTAAVMVWDVLHNLTKDCSLLRHCPRSASVSLVSRLISLCFVLLVAIYETAPLGNCNQFVKITSAFYPLAVSSTSLLFLVRIHAISKGKKHIVYFFVLMWLVVTGGCTTAATGASASVIGPTKYCIDAGLKPYIAASVIIPLVNDTLVFLVIGLQLVSSSSSEEMSLKKILRVLFGRDELPTHIAVARVLLKDGQLYYLIAVASNLLVVTMFHIPSLPADWQGMFIVPNVVLMNIMACTVFRDVEIISYRERKGVQDREWMISGDLGTSATLPHWRSISHTSGLMAPIRSQLHEEA